MGEAEWLKAVSFEDARRCLENACLLERASKHLSRGEGELALSTAHSVLANGGEGFAPYASEIITDALDELAMRYEEVDDWENALRWRKEQVIHEPSALLPRLLLAEDMIMAGNYRSAEQELWELLRRCPRSIEGWTWMARCAVHRVNSLGQKRSADQRAAVRDMMRFAQRSWQVLRKPEWIYYPSETIIRVTLEELYEVTFAALALTGSVNQARQVIEAGIAILGDSDGYLRWLRDSFSPTGQYHLETTSLLSVVDHTPVKRLLELAQQCAVITHQLHNGNYEQAFTLLSDLPADVDILLDGWKTWQERRMLAYAAESAAKAQDVEAEMHYIAQWHALAPSEELPLFRWGELMFRRNYKEALRTFHRLLRRSQKYIEALIEVARLHYAHRRLRLACRFVAKAWGTLPSPDWCYYPSEAVVKDRLRNLFSLTEKLASATGNVEQAEQVKREGQALLGESVVFDGVEARVNQITVVM